MRGNSVVSTRGPAFFSQPTVQHREEEALQNKGLSGNFLIWLLARWVQELARLLSALQSTGTLLSNLYQVLVPRLGVDAQLSEHFYHPARNNVDNDKTNINTDFESSKTIFGDHGLGQRLQQRA